MLDCRFAKSDRILKPRDFRAIYDKGKRFHSNSFIAFVVSNDVAKLRVGITATKKFGNAVERNRAKRLLREVFRCNKDKLTGGFDLVLNVRRSLLSVEFIQLEEEFLGLLRRIDRQWLSS